MSTCVVSHVTRHMHGEACATSSSITLQVDAVHHHCEVNHVPGDARSEVAL